MRLCGIRGRKTALWYACTRRDVGEVGVQGGRERIRPGGARGDTSGARVQHTPGTDAWMHGGECRWEWGMDKAAVLTWWVVKPVCRQQGRGSDSGICEEHMRRKAMACSCKGAGGKAALLHEGFGRVHEVRG